MSARDAESGSSSYKGGSGRAGGLGNGGIGGGMGGGGNHGGGMGGGAGRNGGGGSQTGLSTGKTMYGNTAWGRPGGYTQGYATRLSNGRLTDFRRPDGTRPRPIKSALSQAAPEAVGAPPPAVQPPITGPWPGQAVQPPNWAYNPAPYPPTPYFKPQNPNGVHPAEHYINDGLSDRYFRSQPYDPRTSPGNIRPGGNYGAVRTGRNSSEMSMNQPGGVGPGRPSQAGPNGYGR